MVVKLWARVSAALLIASALAGATAASASATPTLNGAGSTLVYPFEQEWQSVYETNHNIKINFNPVGSASGYTAVCGGSVDFGASDAPLSAYNSSCGLVQIPWALSATGVGIHVNGMSVVHLTGAIIGRIYTGQITNWDNPAIQRLNGHHMPNLKITPVHRLDGSGDTYAFSVFESRTSPVFKRQIGEGTTLNFLHGIGARGNTGMVQALKSTNGAIAYVAATYLALTWRNVASIQNRAGRFRSPNYANILNAGQSASVGANNAIDIINPPAQYANAYPISTFTYAFVKTNASQGALLRQFIGWDLSTGQAYGPRLFFVPLNDIPGSVLRADRATLNQIH